MREAFGDIWELAGLAAPPGCAPVVCVTTNLRTNSQGHAIMGGGIAKECRDRFFGVDMTYGRALKKGFKSTFYMGPWSDRIGALFHLIMFPTKDDWKNNSIPDLIEQSAEGLVSIADYYGLKEVHLPRPGCGLGGLQWSDVSALIGPILDDRFVIVGFASEAP